MLKAKINWNGFRELAVAKYPQEVAGFMFTDRFDDEMTWHVFPVKNVADDPLRRFRPDKKETAKIKSFAKQSGLIKIGNVHTHPVPEKLLDKHQLPYFQEPSDVDLSYAKRYNDFVRGIVVVSGGKCYVPYWHDMFGKEIKVKEWVSTEKGLI